MLSIRVLFVVILTAAFTKPVLADCPEPTTFLSDSSGELTSKYINFLICLHNEQAVQINELEKRLRELEAQIQQVQN
jgi:TolA-binding protein